MLYISPRSYSVGISVRGGDYVKVEARLSSRKLVLALTTGQQSTFASDHGSALSSGHRVSSAVSLATIAVAQPFSLFRLFTNRLAILQA